MIVDSKSFKFFLHYIIHLLSTLNSSLQLSYSSTQDLVAEQPVAVEEETDPKAQHAIEQPVAEIPAGEQRADPPKRRSPNINQSVARTLHNFPEGTKIPLTMDKQTKTFFGTSATKFATECGIVIRNVCPMNFHTWDSVPKDVKTLMYEKLEVNNVFMEYVDARLRAQWKCTRGVLSQHWKKNGGKTNPLVARSNMKPDCRSEEDWNHLCNYWELEKIREGPQPHAKAEKTPWGWRGAKTDQAGAATVHTGAASGSASASPCTIGTA
ncbi:hypothetical protein E3N88_18829 [Mikania micrantha]|uniref:Uncharacterized protein n=1 Tax=Mikania micrantha TaxID=192012 RepID=A0A5N6NNG2_9ASTR|nr:hypothetical protein E3N88_18829 [Mikania micrantha]